MTVLCAGTQLLSQVLDQLAAQLIKNYENNAQELIVLQTDKSIYKAGTDIWFRAYSVSSNGFAIDSKDKVIYVELANDKDSVIDRILLNKEALQYNGSIAIPGLLSEGVYQLRTYTKNILQKHPADVFISTVYITNGDKPGTMDQHNNNGPIYKFYPEGDNLINGVNSAVVFTAADKNGMPVQVSGYVKDNFGNEVVKFNGNGIGKFSFEPYSKDRTYKVYIKTNNTAEQVYSLPAIKTGAFQLSLQKQTPEELVFRVALGDSAYNKKASSYLLGVAGGKICFASEGKAMYMVNIPVNTLPHGMIDFYLYDANKELKSKRTVFNEQYNAAVNITADKQEYGSRQKAKLDINITDNAGKPVKAVFSVAITDKKLTGENLQMHAVDIYMLSRNNTGLMMADLITNSESRDLAAIIADTDVSVRNTPEVKTDQNFYWDGLEIKGRIADKQNTPLAGQIVMLLPEEDSTTLNDSTDSKGVFAFRDITFYGKKRFYVMMPSVYNKQQNYEVNQEEISYPVVRTSAFYNFNAITPGSLAIFKQQHADSSVTGATKIYLNQLTLQEAGTNKKTKGAKSGLLSPRRITGEQLDKLSLSNTVDAVKMLPGVVMMGGRLTLRGGIQNLSGNLSDVEPLLIVDGVNTGTGSVVDYLNSIPPSNIDYIEAYIGPEASIYGTRGGNGAIVVKTSSQLRENMNVGKDKQVIVASGFYKEQKFYEPPYDNYAVREARFTDNRATIYWNGQVITDDTGKATISFYTADLKNDYTVTVQGITEKGELIFKTYTLKRKIQ